MGNYHARCGAGEKPEVVIPEAYLSLFGEVPEFDAKISTMRKYNISTAVILQDLAQLEALYKESYRTIRGNCATQLFLGSPEDDTLKHFSEKLGVSTVTAKSRGSSSKKGPSKNFQETKREVMTADELGVMNYGEAIVYMQNERPVKGKKYDLKKHPRYKETYEGSGKNEEYAFNYTEMSVYDTSKISYIDNFLAAESDAANYVNCGVSNLMNPGNMKGPFFSPEDVQLTKSEKNAIASKKKDELLETVVKCKDPVCFEVVTATASQIKDMLVYLKMCTAIDIILFREDRNDLIGYGCSNQNLEQLLKAVQATQMAKSVSYSEEKDCICITMKKNAYTDTFKTMVIEYLKKGSKEKPVKKVKPVKEKEKEEKLPESDAFDLDQIFEEFADPVSEASFEEEPEFDEIENMDDFI